MARKESAFEWKRKISKKILSRMYFSIFTLFKVKDRSVIEEHRGFCDPSWGRTAQNHRVIAPWHNLWEPTLTGMKVSVLFTECRGTPRGWWILCAWLLHHSSHRSWKLLFHQILSLKKNGKIARQQQPFHQVSVGYRSKFHHASRLRVLRKITVFMPSPKSFSGISRRGRWCGCWVQ